MRDKILIERKVNKQPKHNKKAIEKAVDMFGSVEGLARKLEVSHTTVYKWVHEKMSPSPMNCIRIEKITNGLVKREEILPDVDWKKFKKLFS